MLHAEAVVDAFDLEARGLDEHLELVVGIEADIAARQASATGNG